ncbi:MAG: histidine--tRNA ligase [Bacteroidetes bacterium]|nr:histidine--tRNA ligase [Bacteroidota bacterium]
MARRNYILDTIRQVYFRYGYQQIETPAMENLTTLTGKYGEEGDQLLFKILNSRIHESKNKPALLEDFERSLEKNTNSELLTERALRYDLTVPFARYVVMHQNDITFPFKRFQIQPVWRADRPQKGRYREFYQCDADVIGSDSLLNEVELIQIMENVFDQLNIKVAIKINNRKILSGIAEVIGAGDMIVDITVAIDKLDKIGIEKVNEELRNKGLNENAIQKLQPLLVFKGNTADTIAFLKTLLNDSEIGKKGIQELEYVFQLADSSFLELDITLARGLNYYTGAIFEVKANDVQIGSITGGGRYDDLTGIFGLPNVSGVGISFGIDRIYDVMNELGLFENLDLKQSGTRVMFVNFGQEEEKFCLKEIKKLRSAGINAELFPDQAKMKKQLAYADAKKIPYVILIGSEEMTSGIFTIKNMNSGEQFKKRLEDVMEELKG